MSDLGTVVSSVAAGETGPGRVLFPSFVIAIEEGGAERGQSAGPLIEAERALWEPLSPDQFPPIVLDEDLPVSERIVHALGQLWDQIEIADAVALVLLGTEYQQTMASLLVDKSRRAAYLESLGMAYSEYVIDSLYGYVELLKMAGKAIARAFKCQVMAFDFSTDVLLGATAGTIDFDGLLAELQGECPEVVTLVSAMSELHAWFVTLRDHPVDVALAVAELLGEVAVAVLEVIRDKEIITTLKAFASDHEAIGHIHGLLLGFVVADIVIDELLTLGAGKVVKGVRWIVRETP